MYNWLYSDAFLIGNLIFLSIEGGNPDDDDNVPAKIYEQPELKQPDPSILILEAHVHACPKPKVTWLCNGDFVKESDRKAAKLEARPGEKNKWNATLTILVRAVYLRIICSSLICKFFVSL